MNLKVSIKVSELGIAFLKKLRTNRRKVDTDEEDLSYWILMEVIAKYFKTNNDRYLELIKLMEDKNV